MWKYLVVFAVVLGLAIYIARQDERATQQAAQNTSQSDKYALSAKADEKHSEENIKNPERYTPSWYGFFRWPNGTTTWAVLLTLLVIAEQVKESAKATQAMRDAIPYQQKAADAALLNAQAVINSERPWITILPEKSNNGYSFWVINHGRTPAEVISYRAETRCMNSIKELPLEPVYGIEHKLIPKMLPPKDSSEILPIESVMGVVDDCQRSEDGTTFPHTGTKVPVFYFQVIYTSPLYSSRTDGKERGLQPYETRMCFYCSLHTGEGMVICGNESYNQQT